ncbi:MAG: O-antigen ligase family protein [Prevotella sp.]|nr:O-antigen ligase family protein [Prevotella sp.]
MKIPKPNIIDFCLLTVPLLPLLSCQYGLCSTVSANIACQTLLGIALYISTRILFRSEKYRDYMRVVIAFIMIITVSFALITFVIYRHTAFNVGFNDVYYFRHLFKPLGFTNNVWAEISLAMTAFSMIAGKFRTTLMFLSIVSTLTTFSRGAYVSLFILLVMMVIISKNKQRLKVIYITASAIFLVFVFCHKEMSTTLSMNNTYSQETSTEWRLNSIKKSIKNTKGNLFIGYGCGSYTMISEDGNIDNFSSFAPNLPVMLLIENGIIGLGLFIAIIMSCGWEIWKYRKEKYVKEIGCMLLVIMLKEMSQSTLLHTKCLCILILFLFAYINSLCNETINTRKYTPIAISIIYISVFYFIIHKGYNNGKDVSNDIKTGIALLKIKKIDNTNLTYIQNNLIKTYNKELFDPYILYIIAELEIKQGKIINGLTLLSKLCNKYPQNAIFAFSCGNAFMQLGKKSKAVAFWKKSIILYPRLLLCKECLNIKNKDYMLFNNLKTELIKSYHKMKKNRGKESAKWGFILNKLGEKEESIHLLQRSVVELPNLSVPWLILGDTQKYNFLTYGLLINKKIYIKDSNFKSFSLYDLFKSTYQLRYATSYADNLDENYK